MAVPRDALTSIKVYNFMIQVYKQSTSSSTNGLGLDGCKMWFFSSNSIEDVLSDMMTIVGTAFLFCITAIIFCATNTIPLKHYNCFPYNFYELIVRLIWPVIVGYSMVLLIYSRNKKMRSCLKSELSDYVVRLKELWLG